MTREDLVPWFDRGLHRLEARLAATLHAANGECVTWDDLLDSIYWDHPNEPYLSAIKTLIVEVRRKLEGEYTITNVYGQGYRMTRNG